MSNLDKQMPLPAVGCENCKTLEQWVHDCQARMYINCVYCGHRYGPDDEVAPTMQQALYGHIAKCPKHPLSAMKRRAERAEARLAHPEDAPGGPNEKEPLCRWCGVRKDNHITTDGVRLRCEARFYETALPLSDTAQPCQTCGTPTFANRDEEQWWRQYCALGPELRLELIRFASALKNRREG